MKRAQLIQVTVSVSKRSKHWRSVSYEFSNCTEAQALEWAYQLTSLNPDLVAKVETQVLIE